MNKTSDLVISLAIIAIMLSALATSLNAGVLVPYIQRSINEITSIRVECRDSLTCNLIAEVAREVELIRGLRFKKPIDVIIVNTSWVIGTWSPKEDSIPKDLICKEMLLKLTLLIPYEKTIIQLEKSWMGMFVAAVAGTTIYINTDYFNPIDSSARNILSHELTHVLQFMYFNIGCHPTTDNTQACMALIEGDAGLTQHFYCNKTGLCIPSKSTDIYLADMYISLNLFPYIYGEKFVYYLYKHGGWMLVNKAYENPPSSTIMVMRPDLYLDHLVNNIDIVRNVSISRDMGIEPVYSDSLGAYYTMLVLIRLFKEIERISNKDIIERAMDIALNWRGDRVELYNITTSYKNEWILLWNTTWSSPLYAKHFYENTTEVLKMIGNIVYTNKEKSLIHIKVSRNIDHYIYVYIKDSSVFIESRYIEKAIES